MVVKNVKELAVLLEKKYDKALWRNCIVQPADRNADGRKKYVGEQPSLMPDDIKNDRGFPTMSKKYKDQGFELSLSICLKAIPELFVIDFDQKETCNDDNELFKYCQDTETYYTITQKGFHFYFHINEMPEFSNPNKIALAEYGEVDIVGRCGKECRDKNVVENMKAIVAGKNLKELDWEDLCNYFDFDKMNSGFKKKVRLTHTEKKKSEQMLAIGGEKIELEQIVKYLDRLNKEMAVFVNGGSGRKRIRFTNFLAKKAGTSIAQWNIASMRNGIRLKMEAD